MAQKVSRHHHMPTTAPTQVLLEGIEHLRPILEPHGFMFRLGVSGSSSGGPFAGGTFTRGERELELHFRFSLGLVTYRIGDLSIGHEDYLRFSGQWAEHSYPNFGSAPIESFMALASDLSAFFADFIAGAGDSFTAVVRLQRANPNRFKGFGAIGAK